ncbi:DUF5360 family protein [Amycolatopsis granulosa]|uniref:DUF5360 family protein n=1 Tax=Amycolatopsis granulosa TaxID=185684 RepID=UPI001ABB0301|nr:DUF5360 family protein [Amycolatopsis granulosa]NIH85479.1 hypothetical protein [Amycolatopsis granulosa]
MSEKWIKRLMFGTDVGFLLYWLANVVRIIPPYPEPVLNAWNWSFLGLDVIAATTGLMSLRWTRRRRAGATALRAVSLALTHAAGLLAISFWALRGEFDPAWWLPNLWLTLFPLAALVLSLREGSSATPAAST